MVCFEPLELIRYSQVDLGAPKILAIHFELLEKKLPETLIMLCRIRLSHSDSSRLGSWRFGCASTQPCGSCHGSVSRTVQVSKLIRISQRL